MTQSERLASIEAIATRTETKLDKHIEKMEARVSKLERAWAWLSGVVGVVGIGLGAWLKGMFGSSR